MTPQEPGLNYWVESYDAAGRLESRDLVPTHNLVPDEGLNLAIGNMFLQVPVVPAWFVGLYGAAYAPTHDVTAATLPGLASEVTAYTPTARVPFVPGTVTGGAIDNSLSLAVFTFTTGVTVTGAFISSASAKGSTAGVLGSVVQFPSPKVKEAGSILRVYAGPSAISA